jgi:hypothetical protein
MNFAYLKKMEKKKSIREQDKNKIYKNIIEILRRNIMLNEKNKLLEYFGLNSYSEIVTYIRDNPEDEKVKEIKDLFKAHSINLDEEVNRNEK